MGNNSGVEFMSEIDGVVRLPDDDGDAVQRLWALETAARSASPDIVSGVWISQE